MYFCHILKEGRVASGPDDRLFTNTADASRTGNVLLNNYKNNDIQEQILNQIKTGQ